MSREGQFTDEVFSTVKAFALKGSLLPSPTLEGFTDSKDLDDLVTRLKATVYNESVSKLPKPYSANKLELAFKEHLAQIHYSLVKVTPVSQILQAYYLRYTAANLKTILKGRALGKTYDDLVPYVAFFADEQIGRRELVVKALAAASLDDVAAHLMDTEFGPDIRAATELFKEKGDIQIFDLYIDRAFYRYLLGIYLMIKKVERVRRWQSESKRAEPILSVEVDSFNVLTVLRAKQWGLPHSEIRSLLLVPGFAVSTETLELMIAAGTVAEAAKYLSPTPYSKLLPEDMPEFELISKLEEGFEVLGFERAFDPFLWDVFGLGLALGIVKLKQLEVKNLSAIAFGVEEKIGAARIRSKLVALRPR